MNKKTKPDFYICKPLKGKCKYYNKPENECPHAVPHDPKSKKFTKDMDFCELERDLICGGKCFKVTKK